MKYLELFIRRQKTHFEINVRLQFLKVLTLSNIDTNLLRVNTFFIRRQTTFIILDENERKTFAKEKDIFIDDW